MSDQFRGKILVTATLAALIGMDGFFSLIDLEIRDTGDKPAIHAQSIPIDEIVMQIPRISSKTFCTQNDPIANEDQKLLNNDEIIPLMDEEFERIEWNENQEEVLRNAINTISGHRIVHLQA